MKTEKSVNAGYSVGLFLRTDKPWSNDQEAFTIERKVFDSVEYGEYLHTVVKKVSSSIAETTQKWVKDSKRMSFASSLKIAVYDGGYRDKFRVFYWAKHHALLIPSCWTRQDWGFYDWLTRAFIQVVEKFPTKSEETDFIYDTKINEALLKPMWALERSIPPLEWYPLAIKADLEDGQESDFLTGLVLNKIEENPRYCDGGEDEDE